MLEPLLNKYSDPLRSVDNIEDLVKVISSRLEVEDFSSISDIFNYLRTPDRADLIDLIVMFARRCTLTHMTSIRTSDENNDFSVVI